MSRLSIELTAEQHKAIKAKAALEGNNIKEYVLSRLFVNPAKVKRKAEPAPCPLCEAYGGKDRKFNKQTEKAMEQARTGKGLKRYSSVEALFAELRS